MRCVLIYFLSFYFANIFYAVFLLSMRIIRIFIPNIVRIGKFEFTDAGKFEEVSERLWTRFVREGIRKNS